MTSQAMENPVFTVKDAEPAMPSGNLPRALAAGIVAAIVGAVIWAALTLMTGTQFGLVAVGLGFLVGLVVRVVGQGYTTVFRLTGAALALASCALGNIFTVIGFAADQNGIGYFQALDLVPVQAYPELLRDFFQPLDALFYGLAAWCGWKYAIVNAD